MEGVMLVYKVGALEPQRYNLTAPPDLDQLQSAVGGFIEAVPMFDDIDSAHVQSKATGRKRVHCVAFCDEEGKLKRKPVNTVATELWRQSYPPLHSDMLCGDVVVVVGDDELMSQL